MASHFLRKLTGFKVDVGDLTNEMAVSGPRIEMEMKQKPFSINQLRGLLDTLLHVPESVGQCLDLRF